ncbi:MAG TPA: glycosyltransferase [Caldithrix abyssi]|uniref:Glycosyltransferase n=1 Tax=Caldithrix abyssi TaxID=187145 RepID=A0A7V4TXM9_CALAY|nr:glycosyltransferase [Caldithrix abyssi]
MIEYYSYPKTSGKRVFSVLIPTWNNLDMLKLCVESIRRHSEYEHQIILHINEGSDGSKKWAEEQRLDHTFSKENTGICLGMNAAAALAKTDYIAYLNDDMYVLPRWDRYLREEIEGIGHDYFFLSATTIEPRITRTNQCNIAPYNYGDGPSNFDEKRLLAEFADLPKADWNGATWPPNVVSRRIWNLVGGYSIEFSPGMYSDPDFSMKLWQLGVRYFKGLAKSRVYHFMSKSTGRINKNNGSKQFLHKWGLTNSTFSRFYLKRGSDFEGPLPDPEENLALKIARMKSKIKIMLNLP